MSARVRYVTLTALRWLPVGLLVPVYVRLMLASGLDLATVGTVMIVYTVTVIALEVPTGGLADTIGTRSVLVVGTLLAIAMYGGLLVADHAIAFVAIAVVHGAERALRSGPLEAWYVSDAVAHGRDDTVTRGVSLGAVAEAGALGVGALLAGLLPLLVPDASILRLPIAVALGCEVAHLVLVWLLVPPHVSTHRDAERSPPQAPSCAAACGSPRRIATCAGCWSRLPRSGAGSRASSCSGSRASRASFPRPTSDAWIFGLFGAAAFFFAAAGALVAARADGTGRPARAAAFGTFGYGLCFIGLASAGGVVPFGVAYAASYLFQSASGPYHRTLLHAGTPSAARATMLSVDSLALMAGGLVSNAVLSRVADATSIPFAWGVRGRHRHRVDALATAASTHARSPCRLTATGDARVCAHVVARSGGCSRSRSLSFSSRSSCSSVVRSSARGRRSADYAALELRTRAAVGGTDTPLVGPYSRYGWNHPGAAGVLRPRPAVSRCWIARGRDSSPAPRPAERVGDRMQPLGLLAPGRHRRGSRWRDSSIAAVGARARRGVPRRPVEPVHHRVAGASRMMLLTWSVAAGDHWMLPLVALTRPSPPRRT